ncbi:MAG: hypothetical protein ACRD2G_13995 [Terriglobia bacterium]
MEGFNLPTLRELPTGDNMPYLGYRKSVRSILREILTDPRAPRRVQLDALQLLKLPNLRWTKLPRGRPAVDSHKLAQAAWRRFAALTTGDPGARLAAIRECIEEAQSQ